MIQVGQTLRRSGEFEAEQLSTDLEKLVKDVFEFKVFSDCRLIDGLGEQRLPLHSPIKGNVMQLELCLPARAQTAHLVGKRFKFLRKTINTLHCILPALLDTDFFY